MKVLYGVSPIGLGHATRAVAVGEELARRGAEVVFATGGNAVDFMRSCGLRAEDAVTEPVPRVVSGVMRGVSLWYLRYWLGYRKSRRAMTELADSLSPDVVVGDEEFSGLSLAVETRMKSVMISDELELDFARSALAAAIESRVERWYVDLQSRVDVLVVPDHGRDDGNRRHVGPIVRRVTKSRREVLEEHSLPSSGRMVLLSLSGAGIGDYLVEPTLEAVTRTEGAFLAVSGNRGGRIAGERVYDLGVVSDNQNLVAAADLVVSSAGKSTIDEAVGAGTPIIAIPFKNHAEQERNAAALGYAAGDAARISALLPELIGRRGEPRSSEGAGRTADIILGAGR